MPDSSLHIFATDADLFDLLVSSRQRITERVMLELARDRRIFMSNEAPREDLAEYLSTLNHDHDDVVGLIAHGEMGSRNEKTTFVAFDADIELKDVHRAFDQYQESVKASERLNTVTWVGGTLTSNIEYEEFDHSRTRLFQRQQKSAELEVTVEGGQVRMRLPSTEKAKKIAARVIDLIEREKKATYRQQEVSVTDLPPELRSRFFLRLMTTMSGYRPETVTRLKVTSSSRDEEDDDDTLDGESTDSASTKMLHLVENVALKGENLLASPQYRQLAESGFFITSMTWRAEQTADPRDRVQFDVSFEDGKAGFGFRYLVRIAELSRRGAYPQQFKAPSDTKKKQLFDLIETTARSTIAALRADLGGGQGDDD
jgi:hypothetical protein